MKTLLILVGCIGFALGQGYAPAAPAPPAPAPPPAAPAPAAPPPAPAAPPAAPAGEYPRVALKPSNPYDIEGEEIDKGGEVSKGNLYRLPAQRPAF